MCRGALPRRGPRGARDDPRRDRDWSLARCTARSRQRDHRLPHRHAVLAGRLPFLWWLTAGLVLIDQLGPAVLVGFFAGLLLWISGFPLALREAQRRIARTYQAVLLFSIVCLAAFAAWLVWYAAVALL